MKDKELSIKTISVHAGEQADPSTGATVPNISMATSYRSDPEAGFSVEDQSFDGPPVYSYTRWSNPTVDLLCNKLAALEGAEQALAFGSGMAAISTLLFHVLKAGDHLIMSDVTYAGASELANHKLPSLGIEVTRVNLSKLELLEAAIQPNTKLIYAESPCNPICRLTDLQGVAAIAKRVGALMAVDSTFATPMGTRALELGADFVIHSLTKYLGGHGDAVGGALLGARALIGDIHQSSAARMGGIISPFNAWLINRGLATYPLRMAAHEAAAAQVATYLEGHEKVTRVIYPGLSSHPQYVLAQRQMQNFSGMLTFQVEDAKRATALFAEHLKLFHYAVSLGHHKSLLFYLDTQSMLESSFHLTTEQEEDYRVYAGDGFFRMSVGIEDGADLCADLKHVLDML